MTPPKTRRLFISYRSSDAAKVDKIAKDLSLLKYDDGTPRYTTWQDKHNLPPASPHWWDAIVDAIIDCDLFVFNLSRASLQSEVCLAELEYAHARNLPIIPIVLDGEFTLDPASGNYTLDYWKLVPGWLAERQLLFYVSTEFYARFQQAVAVFERKWPRIINAPRPMNPDGKAPHRTNHAKYDAACDYAQRLVLAEARQLFDELVRRNDPLYGEWSADWLELLIAYSELLEIQAHPAARFAFKNAWEQYMALFPKPFLEGVFDPRGFGSTTTPNPPLAAPIEATAAAATLARSGHAPTQPIPSVEVTPPSGMTLSARYSQARQWYSEGRYDEALNEFRALLASGFQPKVGRLETLIGEIETIQQQQAQAQLAAEQAAQHAAACAETYEELAAEVKSARTPRRKMEVWRAVRQFRDECSDYGDPLGVLKFNGPNLLPGPFEWVEIPGGRGTMKTDQASVTLTIPAERYLIAKYPVTNAQFAKFIEAGGYRERKWWTTAGWEQRASIKWTKPRYWTDSNFNGAEQPVVGVSWYEAVAFCLWLSGLTDEKIMLPTEEQWQYAAQGDEGRGYPWGRKWDAKCCNNSVNGKGVGTTTAVRAYEGKGDSPFGVVDMAGNVWEWCLTDYENRTNDMNSVAEHRVLRGGSWAYNNTVNFRCDCRIRLGPNNWDSDVGFRLALS